MLAPYPEKVALVGRSGLITRDWWVWLRDLLLAVNGESGDWTPTDASGASLVFTNTSGNCGYVRLGAMVQASFRVTYPVTADGSGALIGGLPFVAQNTTVSVYGGVIALTDEATAASLLVTRNAQTFGIYTTAGAQVTNATMSGNDLRGLITYRAAA